MRKLKKWNTCTFPADEDALKDRICYGGLDLSSTTDFFLAYNFEIRAYGIVYLFDWGAMLKSWTKKCSLTHIDYWGTF